MKTIASTLTRLRPRTLTRSPGEGASSLVAQGRGRALWVARSGAIEVFERPSVVRRPAEEPVARPFALQVSDLVGIVQAPRGAWELVLHVLGYR